MEESPFPFQIKETTSHTLNYHFLKFTKFITKLTKKETQEITQKVLKIKTTKNHCYETISQKHRKDRSTP